MVTGQTSLFTEQLKISQSVKWLISKKMLDEAYVNLILSLFKQGKSKAEIARILTGYCSLSTVKRVLQNPDGYVNRNWNRGPPSKVNGIMGRRVIFGLVHAKRNMSIRKIAKKEQIHKITVRSFLKKKKIKVFKRVKRFFIRKDHAARRRSCCRLLLKKVRKTDLGWFAFADECYVIDGDHTNVQNDRCYGKDFDLIPEHRKFLDAPKSPLKAMVFGAIWKGGRNRLIVLPIGFKLNSNTYIESCLTPFLEDISHDLPLDEVVFYNDLASSHTSGKTQTFLKANLPKFIPKAEIPPTAPDVTPMDFAIWNELKERLRPHGPVANFVSLKKILQDEWNAIPQQFIDDSIDAFPGRIRRVVDAKGFHI